MQRAECSQRYASFRDRLHDAQVTWARLAAVFLTRCRRYYTAARRLDPPRIPLYGVVAGPEGILRLLPRHGSSGGTGRTALRCWTEAVSGTMVLHAEGEVDIVTAPMLGDAIAASYRAAPRVIVDLGGLRYLDGSGVRVLEEASREHPRRFVVAGSTREIHRLFELLNLTNELPVVRSLDAAREYFGLE